MSDWEWKKIERVKDEVWPEPRNSACSCVCGGYVYVINGFVNALRWTNEIWRFSIQTRKWEELSPGEGREGTCSSVCAVTPDHKHIYVCGGSNGSGPTAQFHRYSVELDEWEQLEDCPPEVRIDICCEYLDGNLLFVGHRTYVWRYNIAARSWNKLECPLTPELWAASGSHHGATTVVDGKVWLVGGSNIHRLQMGLFDPKTQSWEERYHGGDTNSYSAMCRSRNWVYMFGGYKTDYLDLFMRIPVDLYSNSVCWLPIRCSGGIPKLYAHVMEVIPGHIFVYGGYNGVENGDVYVMEIDDEIHIQSMQWNPNTHHLFPKDLKQIAHTLISLYTINSIPLPREVLWHVTNMVLVSELENIP